MNFIFVDNCIAYNISKRRYYPLIHYSRFLSTFHHLPALIYLYFSLFHSFIQSISVYFQYTFSRISFYINLLRMQIAFWKYQSILVLFYLSITGFYVICCFSHRGALYLHVVSKVTRIYLFIFTPSIYYFHYYHNSVTFTYAPTKSWGEQSLDSF